MSMTIIEMIKVLKEHGNKNGFDKKVIIEYPIDWENTTTADIGIIQEDKNKNLILGAE